MWRDGELPVAANVWSLKHAHREGIVTAELDREVRVAVQQLLAA